MALSSTQSLLLLAALSVAILIFLIARFKWPAFVALIVASLVMGVGSGMKLSSVAVAFQEGVGAILMNVAAVVGLGAILGKLLAESGGAEVMARRLVTLLGPQRLPWTMLLLAILVGIPTWFAVGLVLLVPILFSVLAESRAPFLKLAIPMAAGLSVMHGLIPPHPGPMVAIDALKADVGRTIILALVVGVPVSILAGPLLGNLLARHVPVQPPVLLASARKPDRPAGFAITLLTILVPVGLMLLSTVALVKMRIDHPLRESLLLLGSPLVAMTVAVLFSFYSFGVACGYGRVQLQRFCEECLGPVASVLLVVGAGGGFNKVLVVSGVGPAIASVVEGGNLSPLVLGWFFAALIRVATGSATVAITTAVGLIGPLIASNPEVNRELLVISMGCGSLILSHLNDGGFWFVKEYFQLSVPQTLKTWTVMETVIAIAGLGMTLLLDLFI